MTTLVRAAMRAIDILEELAREPEGLGISELARRLSMPKSSTHNLVKTLLQREYLEQDATGRFVLGARLFDIGVCGRPDSRLQAIAQGGMQRLMNEAGESAFLGILTPDLDVVFVAKAVSHQPIRYDQDIGQSRRAHCSSAGKVLLAHLPDAQLRTYLRTRTFERFTPKTITTRRDLLRELEEVRRSGVAFNIDEQAVGVSSIAAPIQTRSGRTLAALLVAGPTARLRTRREQLVERVRAAAREVSGALETAYVARIVVADEGADARSGRERGPRPAVRRRAAGRQD